MMKHSRRAPQAGMGCMVRAMAALVLTMCSFAAASFEPLAQSRYEFGRGLEFPALHFALRGYTSAKAQDLEGLPASLAWHDLSLFAIWSPTPSWQVFSEIEGEDLLAYDDRGVHSREADVQVERLYVDHTTSRYSTVRAGRFLTPFGRWNQIHADPLVWTVTRPLVTVIAIPDHVSGVMVYGTVPLTRNSIEYGAYIDASDEFDPDHGHGSFEDYNLIGLSNDMEHAAGGQLRYHFLDEHAQIGASYASFAVDGASGYHHLFGLDGIYTWHRFELSSEVVYRANIDQAGRDDWGGFVQLVVPLIERYYAVGRLEYYSSGPLSQDAQRGTVGLVWRPQAAISFKFEYHEGSDRSLLPDGIELSCGLLF